MYHFFAFCEEVCELEKFVVQMGCGPARNRYFEKDNFDSRNRFWFRLCSLCLRDMGQRRRACALLPVDQESFLPSFSSDFIGMVCPGCLGLRSCGEAVWTKRSGKNRHRRDCRDVHLDGLPLFLMEDGPRCLSLFSSLRYLEALSRSMVPGPSSRRMGGGDG